MSQSILDTKGNHYLVIDSGTLVLSQPSVDSIVVRGLSQGTILRAESESDDGDVSLLESEATDIILL